MKFMGDFPQKGQTEQDLVATILRVNEHEQDFLWLKTLFICICKHHLQVLSHALVSNLVKWGSWSDEGRSLLPSDEASHHQHQLQTVRLPKQRFTNTNDGIPFKLCLCVSCRDSCQRGWRLMYILTAFHRCSEVMKPFLLKFLQDASENPGMAYQGIAKASEQNLKRTFQYGGRAQYPNTMELKAMLAGRSSKRQLFLLPGGIERHLKIKTCSVALDVIEELCFEMGLQRLEALDEYAVFLVTHKGQNVRPLNKREYILDIATEAEKVDANYSLWFRRVIWSLALKLDNELYVTMLYNQVILPDYLKALLSVVPLGKASDQHLQQIARLAALQHRAKDSIYLPTIREVQECVPPQFYSKQGSQQWLNMTMQHTQQVQALNAHQARAQFLGKSADLDFCFKLSAFSTDKYCGITTRVFIIIVPELIEHVLFMCLLLMCLCVWLGGHGTFPPKGGPVDPHPETNFRLQLSLCGYHDRGSAQPAHYPVAARAGVCSHTLFMERKITHCKRENSM
uniref:MyTH4 domain-containing protein n=1 Tax=Oryzias latipes TaxID=8090 RepID=A0A3B3HW44_ORYLA